MATIVHYKYAVQLPGLMDWSAFLERVSFKSVFLEILNVTTGSVFQNQVTFILLMIIKTSVDVIYYKSWKSRIPQLIPFLQYVGRVDMHCV